MAYAAFTKPFRLHTDASIFGLGAVLYQEHDGVEKVISYTIQSVSKSESKYPIHKLEFLGLKWAITDQFHKYLNGNTFDIYTDNNPLTYVLSTATLDPTEHRWIAGLANYNFHIHYKSRKSNVEADTLSRIEREKCDEMIQAESIHAVVTAAIAGDLVNIEAVSCGMQVVEPFLPIQSEPMTISKTITWLSDQRHLEERSSEARKVVNADDSSCLTARQLEDKLNPKCMSMQDWIEAQSKDKIIGEVVQLFKSKKLCHCKISKSDNNEIKQFTRQCNRLFF